MKGICPICEKETELEVTSTSELLTVRGEEISVPVELFKCTDCGENFENPVAECGPVELAYREYRKRRCLLQPEEIKEFRIRFGLTQYELGKLLGFGGATISRYENGALQDDAHDKALRFSMNLNNLIQLLQQNPVAMLESKRSELLKRLREEEECLNLQSQIERLGAYEADIRSGYKNFDYSKFINAVLLFCKQGQFTTCLNKLLFYADFLHFKTYAVSLTGLRYAHMPHGPAIDKYLAFLNFLLERNFVEVEEVIFDRGSGERFSSKVKVDLDVFDESELRCLLHVNAILGNKSATDVSNYSHEETAYKETKNGKLISYTLAESLSLEL